MLRERAVSATNCAGKLEKHVQNNATGPLSHTIHKAEIDQGLQHKAWYHNSWKKNVGKKLTYTGFGEPNGQGKSS